MRRWTMMKIAAAGSIVLACAVAAFRGSDDPEGLFLYCGAGIRPAMEAIREDFTAQTGIPVTVTYAGSGCLLSMLTFARSGDLYMPGERYYMDQAIADGHVLQSERAAHFVAVVMVRKGNPKNIRSLRDLARPDVRVGLGETESVACGLTARTLLQNAGLWEEIKANVDARGAYTGSAIELSNALVLNALDAVINWDAMAFAVRDQVDILTIAQERNVEVEIPLAVLTWSRHKARARQFQEFVCSEPGRRLFEAHGFHSNLDTYALPYYGNTVIR